MGRTGNRSEATRLDIIIVPDQPVVADNMHNMASPSVRSTGDPSSGGLLGSGIAVLGTRSYPDVLLLFTLFWWLSECTRVSLFPPSLWRIGIESRTLRFRRTWNRRTLQVGEQSGPKSHQRPDGSTSSDGACAMTNRRSLGLKE
jgi:hypothetical protein